MEKTHVQERHTIWQFNAQMPHLASFYIYTYIINCHLAVNVQMPHLASFYCPFWQLNNYHLRQLICIFGIRSTACKCLLQALYFCRVGREFSWVFWATHSFWLTVILYMAYNVHLIIKIYDLGSDTNVKSIIKTYLWYYVSLFLDQLFQATSITRTKVMFHNTNVFTDRSKFNVKY